MSRIYDALERARALGPPEGKRRENENTGRDEDVFPSPPAEWAADAAAADHPRPKARPVVRESAVPIVGSNGSNGSNGDQAATKWAFSYKIKEKLVVGNGVDHAALEQYRRLAAVLHLAQRERGADKTKIVMVSSSLSSEGKTLTCVNLALTLSESYHRSVLLVDGDLRRPWLHEIFQVPNHGGLNDSLTASEAKIPIRQVSERLSLLTAGSPAPDPMRVLSSPRMEHVLEQARGQFDWVLLDTPPITLLSDASLLACKADLVVLVVQAGKTSYDVVQRAVEALGRDRLIGVVLNQAHAMPASIYAAEHYAAAAPLNSDAEGT